MRQSPRRERILRAVIAAMRPRGHGFDQPIDEDVLRDVSESLRDHLPAAVRYGLALGLYFIEYAPPVYARRWRRFSDLTPAEGVRCLAEWEHRRGIRGGLFRGFRTLIYLSFYQHPSVLAHLGVAWEERARMLVRRRAELVHARSSEASDEP
jgi:hypothetical protein